MSKTHLLAAIDNDRAELVDFLRRLVRASSPNPPGDTRAAADVVRSFLATRDIEASVIAPRAEMPNVVSEFEGNAPGERLILNGHLDVFPVGDANGWERDPWSGDLEDGNVHGRGACDMKAGTAASVIAFSYLYGVRHRLRGSLGLTAVSDEETGGRFGSRWLLENDTRWLGDCMLNGEPSGLGTIRFAEKGTLRLTFTIRTTGAHGAYVHRTESATRLAAALIDRLASIESLDPDLPAELVAYLARAEVSAAVDEAMGKGASDIVVRPTLNIGIIQGGLKVNMIPDGCRFEADIRLPIGLKADRVIQVVQKILQDFPQARMSVQEAASNPSNFCPHDHRMVHVLAGNVAAITGKRPLAAPSLGATDCKFWRYRGVPAYVFGPAPDRMAIANEWVRVSEFITVIKAHVLSAWEYLDGGD